MSFDSVILGWSDHHSGGLHLTDNLLRRGIWDHHQHPTVTPTKMWRMAAHRCWHNLNHQQYFRVLLQYLLWNDDNIILKHFRDYSRVFPFFWGPELPQQRDTIDISSVGCVWHVRTGWPQLLRGRTCIAKTDMLDITVAWRTYMLFKGRVLDVFATNYRLL